MQAANQRREQARDQLSTYRAAGSQWRASGRPTARAHVGEEIRPGIGGHSPDDVARSFEASVRELEARAAEAEREAKRLADRQHQCSARRATLNRLVEAVRQWAAEQSPPVLLPGDDARFVPPGGIAGGTTVHIPEPPPGTRDFFGRPT